MKKMIKLNPISFKIFMDLENDESLEEIFKNLSILKENTKYNGRYAADINFLLKGKEGKVCKIKGIDEIKKRKSCLETLLYCDEGYEWKE